MNRKGKLNVVLSAVLLALSAVSHASYAQEKPPAVDYEYTVKLGDSLSKISRELLNSKGTWKELARHNKLSDAHAIRLGEVLRIPVVLLKVQPAEARIETLTGAVKLNGKPAKVGDAVSEHDVVETATGSGARMRLPDGSTLNVMEGSSVEAKELTKKDEGNFFHTVFKLVSGRIDAIKNPFPAERSPLLIQGMHGTIGVRGTHFRMAQDGDNTLAEIEHGKVGFEAGDNASAIALSAGEGSVADGVTAPAVIPLLPVPVVMNIPQQHEDILVRFDLKEMEDALAFRGEVALEEDFASIVSQQTYKGTQLRITDLKNGTYWLRVRAIDGHGLQGMESKSKFVVKAYPVAPLLVGTDNVALLHGVSPPFAWLGADEAQRYRFQIARDAEFKDVALKQDDIKATSFSFAAGQNLQEGEYYWRVASVRGEAEQGPWSDVRKLRVLPRYAPAPAPAIAEGRMVASWVAEAGQRFEYQLSGSQDFSAIEAVALAEPKIDMAMPAPGQYFVRTRTIDADGYVGPWTPAQSFIAP